MKTAFVTASVLAMLTAGAAYSQQPAAAPPTAAPPTTMTATGSTMLLTAAPAGSFTVTDWYKQNVYDASDAKIGDITDVLVSPVDGKVTAFIIGVGGFLGMGEKEVAVAFDSVKKSTKNDKIYLTMNTTKDALKSARGFKFDRKSGVWIMADAAAK